MDALQSFLTAQCQAHPGAETSVANFVRRFRDTLEPDRRAAWTRGRIVARLAELGYPAGLGDDKAYHVAGLSVGRWIVDSGRLVLA